MLLAIDVGNTNITLGLYRFEGGQPTELAYRWRLQTVHARTADEYGLSVYQLLRSAGVKRKAIEAVILASVVPALTRSVSDLVERQFGIRALVVGHGIKTGMPILCQPPSDVGADRVVNAVAAYARFQSACVVVDFGTATTFDCITQKGEYAGGAIVPGVQVSMGALYSRAARLPKVEIDRPPHVIGKNTTHAMQSGIYFGYAALVDGLIARIRAELSAGDPTVEVKVLGTGGLASVIAEASEELAEIDEGLTLEGLRLLYLRNR